MQHRGFLCALALALVACASGAVYTRPADAAGGFSTVILCAPIGIYITPNASSSIQIDADSAVEAQLETTVQNKVLTISVKGGFTSTNPIKLVVNMPATSLKAVTSSGIGSVQIAKGFTSSALKIEQTGTGGVVADNISVTTLTISSAGTGNIAISGSIGATTITSSGTGNIGISGPTSTISYSGSGTGSLFVKGTSTSVISGSTAGLGKINYDVGACNIPGGYPFGSPCQQTTSITLPAVSTKWTCGLTVTGTFGASNGQCTGTSSTTVNGVVTGGSGTATSSPACASPA